MTEGTETSAWVQACQQGHTEVFGALVRRYQGAGYAVALSFLHDPDDAKDVLQDALVTAFCRLGQLREPAAFGGWFRAIVATEAKVWLRRQRLVKRAAMVLDAEAEPRSPDPTAPAGARLAGQRLWAAVGELPEPQRCVVLLHYLSGFSETEAAAFLQIPVSTVHGRLQQARRVLRGRCERSVLDELEELSMGAIDVSTEMEELLWQVASEPVSLTADLSSCRHVVLFCGAKVDLEVVAAEGDELSLTGNRVSLGMSAEAARESAREIHVEADQVDDFKASGPHPGEVFGGTHWGPDQKPLTYALPAGRLWEAYVQGAGWGAKGMSPTSAFPGLSGRFCPFPEALSEALRSSWRVSIVQAQAQALVLPEHAYQPRLHRVFRPNWHRHGALHGPVGYVSLSLALPRGCCLTVVHADSVVVREAVGRVLLVDCWGSEVAGLEGELFLLNTPASRITGVQGKLYQRCYSFGGMNWNEEDTWVACRSGAQTCQMDQVAGEVDVEVGRVDLELREVRGQVAVMNRYGRTRLVQRQPAGESRYRLESVSGPIEVALTPELLPQVRLAAVTLCGTLDHKPLAEVQKDGTNSMQLAALVTRPGGCPEYPLIEAEVFVRTECGAVRIERLD